MSTMVSTVLGIEREAEARMESARQTAAVILDDAKKECAAAAKSSAEAIRREIADLEQKAAADRAKKVGDVNAAGQAALDKVRNISSAAFDRAVEDLMGALAGK